MIYKVDKPLTDFTFWSGAETNANKLTYDELDQLDDILPEYFGEDDVPTQTEINDLFWFDFDTVCHALGYACIDGEIIRDEEDVPESLAKSKLKEYYDGLYTYTDEQIDAVYQRCVEEGGVFKIDADNDDIELEDLYLNDYAKEAGMTEVE